MSTTVPNTVAPADDSASESAVRSAPAWLNRLDLWCERFGDSVNPILVKETRQALKSRQFVATFSLLLLGALGWTIAGSLSMMPQIYTTPSAPRMMIGYYVVLALPMLLVVPLAAYRSLESEIDDGTLELLSITTLSPWQIVLGKLAGASLQMLLYFVTLFPCLAYAYSLRGVDLPVTLLIVGALAVVGSFLTVAGLFFASLSRARTGRILTMLSLIALLVIAEYALGAVAFGAIWYGNPMTTSEIIFTVVAVTSFAASLGHLMLTATAAQLTPESENRSTAIRLSLLAFTTVIIVLIGLAVLTLRQQQVAEYYAAGVLILMAVWTFSGALIVGERSTITPRIRRELPSSLFSRVLLTWLTPGPATGLIFAIASIVVLITLQQLSLDWLVQAGYVRGATRGGLLRMFDEPAILFAAYLISFLVVTRGIMFLIRLGNDPRVEVGIAGFVVVALMASLVPYSVQLHYNDYQPLVFDPNWQSTNWVFVLATAITGRLPPGVVEKVVGAAVGLSVIALIAAWPATRPRRIATPLRVQEEQSKG